MQTHHRRLALILASAAGLFLLFAAAGYLVWLNWRVGQTIVSAPWRHPVEIVSGVLGPDSEPIARVYGDDWRVTEPVAIGELPPHVPYAFVAAEDVRFSRHVGIDPWGLARATAANVRGGGVKQGGSTITQQLIKQKLFSNARTMRRKVPEMLLAMMLTVRMSKKDVLEGYLNEVYLGESGGSPVYGIDEASRVYFDKPPSRLTADEAALIAGTVRAPNRDNPFKRPEEMRKRRDAILAVMHEKKWLTNEEFETSKARPVRLNEGSLPDAPYPHYLSALRTELATLGTDIPAAGIRIICEIDPQMQEAAERTARTGTAALQRRTRHLARSDDLQVAILSAEPKSGAVRALVGSRDGTVDLYDRTRRMHRQPGSALKPFIYAAALESREYTPVTTLNDSPMRVKLGRNDYWTPRNYDERFRGPVALRVALEQSLNIPTVRLAEDIGLRTITKKLATFGFEEDFEQVPSLPLGVTEVTLRELVAGFSAFPALGTVPELHLVREVRNRRGRSIYRHKAKPKRAIDPAVAWLTHDLLRGVVGRGTASRLNGAGLGHLAGKTGTTTDYRDAWFIGYAPDLVTGLWVGADGGEPLRLSAAEAAVPLWASYMSRIETSEEKIEPPEGIVFREIDPTNGGVWKPGCTGPVREAFLEGTEPKNDCRGRGRTVIADLRGNPEPPEISDETWRRWTADPVVKRSDARRSRNRDEGGARDARQPERRRSSADDDGELRGRDEQRATERAIRDAEEWSRDQEKQFERMRKRQEKALERLSKEAEKNRRKGERGE